MTVTMSTFVDRLARDLQETDSSDDLGLLSSGLFTLAEVVGYTTYVERDFLRQTGILKIDTTVALAPGSPILVTRPSAMDIERISFNGKRVRRVTSWDLEMESPNWRSQAPGPPHYYHEDHLAVNKFEFDRLPAAGGSYRVFADFLPPEHTTDLTETIAVPDWAEPAIRWGVLALCFSKDGDNRDLARAAYAESRYEDYVRLALAYVFSRDSQAMANQPGIR